jgi:hypothetical protein
LRIGKAILSMVSVQTPQSSNAIDSKLGHKEMVTSEAQSGDFRDYSASEAYCRISSEIVTASRPLSSAALITRGKAFNAGSLMPW